MDLGEVEDDVKKLSSDLRFILTERDISDPQQALIVRAGLTTMGLFQAAADDRPGIRALAGALLGDPSQDGITPAEKVRRQVSAAKVVDAWEVAKTRTEEATRVASEQAASRMPRTVTRSYMISLRRKYEEEFGRIPDSCFPCQALVEKRLEEVEEGEVRADALSEVASIEESSKEDILGAHLDKDGVFKFRRSSKSVSLPTDSESLRTRVKMLGITFQLAAYKHRTRLWLQGVSPNLWLQHLEYVLGDEVARMKQTVMDVVVSPPWNVVLSYEFQIRKEACRLVMYESFTLEEAMTRAQSSSILKERHFSTPTGISLLVRRLPQKRSFEETRTSGKGKGKGGEKGSGGGQGKGAKGQGKGQKGHTQTPDGRLICFRYQTKKCSSKKCSFVHVCQRCLGSHPSMDCKESGDSPQQ